MINTGGHPGGIRGEPPRGGPPDIAFSPLLVHFGFWDLCSCWCFRNRLQDMVTLPAGGVGRCAKEDPNRVGRLA